MTICPCSSGEQYTECCARYIDNNLIPETPELLMRSRYTAYTLSDMDYIEKTMKGPALIDFDKEHAKQWSSQLRWKKLKIINSEHDKEKGTVEFIVYYSHQGNPDMMYEISEFQCENNVWYYLDGATPKIGRNDPCPCGSNIKFKKCCGM